MFLKHDSVQVLLSKDSRGNSCITFAKIKEVLPEERCVIVHQVKTFCGKYPLKAPEGAEIVMEDSKIPFKRILKSSEQEMLALQNRYRR
jgi:hypothetical protein